MIETSGDLAKLHLEQDDAGRLVLIDAVGARHSGVEPVRNFPLSDPDRWISICNGEGRELIVVTDLAHLTKASRKVLEADLARREFVPIVRRILRRPADTEPSEWEVETDRGYTRFLVHSDEDVRRLGPTRALIIDTDGIRYLIDDTHALEPASRKIIERYL